MSRKVFISFLGATNYRPCDYQRDGISYGNERFIQISTLRYIERDKRWPSDSIAYILLTRGAEEANWVDGGQKKYGTNEVIIDQSTGLPQTGLKTELKKLNLNFNVDVIDKLPDGNNESEIWTIFQRTFEKIKDEDELYFDFTHGFRYLPMLILVLSNYSKFLKNVKVKSITYGNYEVSNHLGHGLIVDLLPLSQLQDWTFAAGQYLETGNVDRLVNLSNAELRPILKEAKGTNEDANNLRNFIASLNSVIKERQTCRGLSIIKSDNFKKLKESAESINKGTLIKPLDPVIEKIKDSFAEFDADENINNGFASAKWCFDNKLYQQSATILQEVVVTFFCNRHSIAIDDESRREIVNQALILKFHRQVTDEGENWSRVKLENKETLADILSDELLSEDIACVFNNLTEIRNDYNHSGMRSKQVPKKPDIIIKNIEKCIKDFEYLFNPVPLCL